MVHMVLVGICLALAAYGGYVLFGNGEVVRIEKPKVTTTENSIKLEKPKITIEKR